MKTILTVCALGAASFAVAQKTELELDPVTITASVQPKPVSQTGRNIITFKGSSFNNLPVHSVDELLRYLPGVEMQMRGPMGSQSDIVLRGGTFQQVLIMLDGVRINDPNTGHFSSYIPIAPAEIERIEVLKGASSAIYGSEAVGGVVHIITKSFAAKRKQQKLQVQGQASGGEYDLFSANAGGFYQAGNTAVSGGFLSNNTDGQLQRGTRGYVHANTGSLSASQFIGDKLQVSLRAAYDKRDFSAQNFYTTFLSDTAREEVRTVWTQLRVSYTGVDHKINVDAGYKDVKDDYAYNNISIANASTSRMFQVTATDEWKISQQTSMISGAQFINKEISSNDRGNHQVPQGGAFILINHSFLQGFTINPALRLDWNERSGTELIPQISMAYRINAIRFRGSAGKTIRDADFTERYNNYNKPSVASGRIGNPDLAAERSFSYEAGADYFVGSALKIGATFFQRYHRKLIDYVTTSYADMPRKDNLIAGGTYALATNIARVNTTGAELDIQYQHKFHGNNSVYAGAGLVWLNSKSSELTPSFYVSSHAKFMSNFFVEYTFHRFLIGVNGIYKNRAVQQAPAIHATVEKDYFVFNARAAFYTWEQKMNIFVRVDNITNTRYSDLLGAQMPGRWLTGGINFAFSR
jgi:vitamin B12 transporter